ncbi:MAG: peptidoglycan editing factor PgeF [Tissierellia bacterium]|nr:peptidoglycan editing factor PgeF [Tissierellia bacterium]
MGIIEKYNKGVLYYQFESFNKVAYINHLFTSRIGWNNENIPDKISSIFNVPKSNIVNVRQVHGAEMTVIDLKVEDFKDLSKKESDGLITNIPNLILTTSHADCVPIYFLDKRKKVVGLAHGGWRGTYKNITGKMIDTMKNIYNSEPEDILVGIGPSIGPCCYEVSKDLGEQFNKRYSRFKNIVQEKNNKVFLDLWRINYLQAIDKGIKSGNITLSKTCTSCKIDKFYSYRKEKDIKNRMVAAISLDKRMII